MRAATGASGAVKSASEGVAVGLDTVEIFMRIEEEFSIDLRDAELGSVQTVGDLYEVVLSKLNTPTADCLSSKAFYRTRLALVDSLNLPRRSIRPTTPLEPLLPAQSRHRQWDEIATNIGLKFPKLQPSRSQKDMFLKLTIAIPTIVTLALWGAAHVYLGLHADRLYYWILAFIAWIFLIVTVFSLLEGVTREFALELPVANAGDLARMVLTMNFTSFVPASDGSQPLSREAVWERIVFIFSDQMQIDAEEIVPEAKISEDLRID